MSAKENRPATNGPAPTSFNPTASVTDPADTKRATHPAEAAADATMAIWVYVWDQAIRSTAKHQAEFAADDVQHRFLLPSIGNATGGIFMRLAREQVIRKVGYRPSRSKSRSSGVVAVWSAGDAL